LRGWRGLAVTAWKAVAGGIKVSGMGLLRRVFLGSGELPGDLRSAVAEEQPLVLEEGLAGSVTYRRFRAPGEYAGWRKDAVSGAIAVTGRRLVVWAARFKHIDVPHGHPLRAGIEVAAERPDRICIAYDAGAGKPLRSGRVEVRLRTLVTSRGEPPQ
jgi:hypothetical protein